MTIGTIDIVWQKEEWSDIDQRFNWGLEMSKRPAVIRSGLALHWNHWDGKPELYCISHVRSGLRVTLFENRNNAVMALKALGQLTDWESVTVPPRPDLARQVWELLEPLMDVDPFYVLDDDEL